MALDIIIFENLKERDKSEAIKNLVEDSTPRQEFYLLLTLATGIASLGLIIDNIPVVIGSMLIAPLLFPIVALGLSLALTNYELGIRSLKTFFFSTLSGLTLSAILALTFKYDIPLHADSILRQIEPSIAYSLIAFLSGIAASFAYAKPQANISLTGVAISVAVVPPLAATGIGLAAGSLDVAMLSFSQYLINFVLIALSAWLVFAFMDFESRERTAETAIKEEEKEIKEEVKLAKKNRKKDKKKNK